MAKREAISEYRDVNPATLKGKTKTDYEAYKKAYAVAKSLREVFEASAMNDAGCPLAFGYNYGKLRIALAAAEKPKADSKAIAFEQLAAN